MLGISCLLLFSPMSISFPDEVLEEGVGFNRCSFFARVLCGFMKCFLYVILQDVKLLIDPLLVFYLGAELRGVTDLPVLFPDGVLGGEGSASIVV